MPFSQPPFIHFIKTEAFPVIHPKLIALLTLFVAFYYDYYIRRSFNGGRSYREMSITEFAYKLFIAYRPVHIILFLISYINDYSDDFGFELKYFDLQLIILASPTFILAYFYNADPLFNTPNVTLDVTAQTNPIPTAVMTEGNDNPGNNIHAERVMYSKNFEHTVAANNTTTTTSASTKTVRINDTTTVTTATLTTVTTTTTTAPTNNVDDNIDPDNAASKDNDASNDNENSANNAPTSSANNKTNNTDNTSSGSVPAKTTPVHQAANTTNNRPTEGKASNTPTPAIDNTRIDDTASSTPATTVDDGNSTDNTHKNETNSNDDNAAGSTTRDDTSAVDNISSTGKKVSDTSAPTDIVPSTDATTVDNLVDNTTTTETDSITSEGSQINTPIFTTRNDTPTLTVDVAYTDETLGEDTTTITTNKTAAISPKDNTEKTLIDGTTATTTDETTATSNEDIANDTTDTATEDDIKKTYNEDATNNTSEDSPSTSSEAASDETSTYSPRIVEPFRATTSTAPVTDNNSSSSTGGSGWGGLLTQLAVYRGGASGSTELSEKQKSKLPEEPSRLPARQRPSHIPSPRQVTTRASSSFFETLYYADKPPMSSTSSQRQEAENELVRRFGSDWNVPWENWNSNELPSAITLQPQNLDTSPLPEHSTEATCAALNDGKEELFKQDGGDFNGEDTSVSEPGSDERFSGVEVLQAIPEKGEIVGSPNEGETMSTTSLGELMSSIPQAQEETVANIPYEEATQPTSTALLNQEEEGILSIHHGVEEEIIPAILEHEEQPMLTVPVNKEQAMQTVDQNEEQAIIYVPEDEEIIIPAIPEGEETMAELPISYKHRGIFENWAPILTTSTSEEHGTYSRYDWMKAAEEIDLGGNEQLPERSPPDDQESLTSSSVSAIPDSEKASHQWSTPEPRPLKEKNRLKNERNLAYYRRCKDWPYCNDKACKFAHPSVECHYGNTCRHRTSCSYYHHPYDDESLAIWERLHTR